jgi:sugar/nucleoside kinase (ribokinase family)
VDLIVLGTVALDNIKTPQGFKRDLLGGSGTHFAMSARLFSKVNLVGVIGYDFPETYMQFLRRKGVVLTSVIEGNSKSFRWVGEYRKGEMNTAITLSTQLGVLEHYVPQVAYTQRNISNVFLANFDPDVQSQFLHLMESPKFIGMDTMNLWISNKKNAVKRLMKKVHLFVVNDGEARMLSQETNLIKAAKALRAMGPKLIVIKKGEHGVFFYSDQFSFSFSAYPVEDVVDPTGAGDTFAGGLMGYLSKQKKITNASLKKAIIYATALASYNVEGYGTNKTASLTLPKVHSRMKTLIKFISP